ncbi:metallophosphoesterase family protein [Alkaliphilus transvaalensis]|uniref:metallophosphoesterase family protein n=1 Tax=Alkaliphilus transvaalensis TaxID=114628 RepID=UPI00047DAC49|nr:metallophosphoesterase family protein [Alkaliphilus transvaalensis]
MNQIAIISDIHGNIPALNAVLEDIKVRKIDKIICLGDLAGKGPNSAEAVDMVRQHCQVVLKGNWDYYLADEDPLDSLNPSNYWHQQLLGEERLKYMKNLPLYVEFYLSGKLVRLCHASPNDLFHRVYQHSALVELLKLFEETPSLNKKADIVGYGDIHGAYINYFEDKTLFNVGSVGNPLDIPQAAYTILEGKLDSKILAPYSITIVRVPYDIDKAINHAISSDMPDLEEYIKELQTAVYRKKLSKE